MTDLVKIIAEAWAAERAVYLLRRALDTWRGR